ncbi:MAG: DegT/DnrJ/EryC1/StrS family aminotransferase [Alphaproteobacteria bacterium]|nr:DegT/DnrJ/EryC1/StrS family aminotransferase [Alphaproteobacteria bacterium]
MSSWKVRYSYLPQQFGNPDPILDELRRFVPTGDFTLGKPLAQFEQSFAKLIGGKHAIGVNSGTDALKLPLRAVGVWHGDEVITAANTFIATVGAIAELGARPVFVDVDDTFCMDVRQVEAKITPRTKAILPVHLTGTMTDMAALMPIAQKYDLPVVEDACQSILTAVDGKRAGLWGAAAGYSLHPLKNLNVWGDSGIIVTNHDDMDHKLRLLRNHGLRTRDEVEMLGYNSRMDSIQAIVGNWLIGQAEAITHKRIANAKYYDDGLRGVRGIRFPVRSPRLQQVYHLYIVFAERRDELYKFLHAEGVEAKIHYPIPLYAQEGLRQFGYRLGDFPVTDRHAREIISFPADQHLTVEQMDYVVDRVKAFYARG